MEKIITISNVSELKRNMATLSRNVVPSALDKGELVAWYEKGCLLIYASGSGNVGYFWTNIEEKDASPAYLFPQALFTQVVNVLPEDKPATFTFRSDAILCIRSGEDMRFDIRIGASKDKPKVEVPPALTEFDLPMDVLKNVQKKVLPCAVTSATSTTPFVGLIAKDGTVTVNATDNYTLARMQLPVTAGKEFAVATSPTAWKIAFPENDNGLAHFRVTDRFVIVSGKRYSYLVANHMSGMPPYESITSRCAAYPTTVSVEKGKLMEAMKAIEIMATAVSNILEVRFHKESFTLYTEDKEMGHIQMDVPYASEKATELDGKRVGFSYDFFVKGINASPEHVVLNLADPTNQNFGISPVEFVTSDGSVMVVSPVRIE